MLRNVYLEGELGDKYGHFFQIEAEKPAEVFQCLEGNFSDFRKYLIDCHEKDIGFTVEVGGTPIEKEEELLLNLYEGDIFITPVPAGSKSGAGKIFAAIAIAALFAIPGGQLFATQAYAASAAGVAAGATAGFTTAGLIVASLALNLAMTGIQQLMAPDPSVDSDQDESYLFNGPEQNIVEGDPIPVLYGRLRVPGQPISFEILNRKLTSSTTRTNVVTGAPLNGNIVNFAGIQFGVSYVGSSYGV